jgi:predicted nucleic acid-binding protein
LKTLLLDASAILAGLEEDEPHHEAAAALLADDSVSLATIDLARYEAINIAVCRWRKPEKVTALLAVFEGIEGDGGMLTPSHIALARAAEIAEHHSISVYDAAYAAMAGDGDRWLVSCDERDLVSNGLAVLPADALPA